MEEFNPKYKSGDVLINNNNEDESKIIIVAIVADQYKYVDGSDDYMYDFTDCIEAQYHKDCWLDEQRIAAIELAMEALQEQPKDNYKDSRKDKCFGCNNVKGCITCVDGDQWAHYEGRD